MLARKRPVLVAAAATTALLTLVGAALAENYQYRFTTADETLAAQIVHRPTVKGWTGGTVKPDLSADPQCPGYYTPRESDLVITGDKETDYTYTTTGQELDTYAVVFGSAAMAETDWRRSADRAAFFRCLRAKWPTLAPGTKIVSLASLALPRVGTHSFAYRMVFARSGSRIAIDSVNVLRGRIEVEIDQITQNPSAADLANMKAGDRLFANEAAAKLRALG
jgi:hypothetical protein